MRKNIRVMTAVYQNIHLSASEAKNIRGFFADMDRSDSILHNHTPEGQQVYRYPLVQYKVLKGNPVVVAAEEGISSLHPHLMDQEKLTLGDNTYHDLNLDIQLSRLPVGDCPNIHSYGFLTPWLALNQQNYETYIMEEEEGRQKLLERILTGNVLSLCKGFGVTIESQLQVVHHLKPVNILYKGKKMLGFTGSFQVNCCIPDRFGIGKGTARGFGTVKLKRDQNEVT